MYKVCDNVACFQFLITKESIKRMIQMEAIFIENSDKTRKDN